MTDSPHDPRPGSPPDAGPRRASRTQGAGIPDPGAGIGVDGCRGGWVAIRLGGEGWDGRLFESVAELDAEWGGPDTLSLIDIPIGLPEDASFRPCDAAARRLLGRRAPSVFNPPTRAALAAASYAEAAALNERACGKRLSKQTWWIMPGIVEVDRFLRGDPARQGRIREAHPETLFQLLNGGVPLAHGKRRAEGCRERLGVLTGLLPEAAEIVETLTARIPSEKAGPDDLLDALAAAVVAFRFRHALTTLPEQPERDAAGLRCEMVVPRI